MLSGAELSKKIRQHLLKKYNAYVVNTVVTGTNGTADLLACVRGKFYAFEVKGKGDRERKLQREQLYRVAQAGGCGGFVRSINDVDRIIMENEKYVPKVEKVRVKL